VTDKAAREDGSRRKSITLYAGIFLAGVLAFAALLLTSVAYQRDKEFIEHEYYLSERSVANVSEQIRIYIEKERRVARLTADTHGRDFQRLATFPDNQPRETEIWAEVKAAMPIARNFTLADASGALLLGDDAMNVGPRCRSDISYFAHHGHPDEVFVHSNPPGGIGNHIDLVVDVNEPGDARFLFVSLGLEELTDILAKGAAHRHELNLVRTDNPHLELTSAGLPADSSTATADKIILSASASTLVPGTRWELIDVIDPALIEENRNTLIFNSVISFLVFALVCIPLILLIKREEKRRMAAEGALREANNELEQRVTARTAALIESQSELEYLVAHDPLTGLVNRSKFEEELGKTLETARFSQLEGALLYIDLDQFKVINDTAGHIAGDFLLSQLGTLIQEKSREDDVVARLGGDEFGLILNNRGIDAAMQVAEELRTAIKNLRFNWGDTQYDIGASIGLIPINKDSENAQSMMAAADSACFTAKDQGRNQVHYHDPAERNSEHTTLIRRSQEITRAMQEHRLELYCQPIERIAAGNTLHKRFEALLRMHGTEGELITPDHFIPAAERFGHMPDLDMWVTEQALRWLKKAPDNYSLSVNLSGHTVSNPDVLKPFQKLVEKYGSYMTRICFEITETAAVSNYTHARQFITRIREMGCAFALDDYGSGVCSISYLRNLPIDFLKIDGELVTSSSSDSVALAMVESIVTMSKAMDVEIVAEHIEDKHLMKKMQQLGVEYGQGYYFGKPEPLANILGKPGQVATLRPA
jgi:diguanylate cyclase (GGDEF)-like protein